MFRLTAIRETFEESGILLHKTGAEAGAFSFQDREMLSEWRTRVHKEPDCLLRLYRYIIHISHWSILILIILAYHWSGRSRLCLISGHWWSGRTG